VIETYVGRPDRRGGSCAGELATNEQQDLRSSRNPARIPKVFHFVFGLKPQTEPFHLMHYLCLASCMGVNKPDAVMFHCQHQPWGEYWDRIRPQLTIVPVKPDPFISSFRYRDAGIDSLRYAHLADVARLEILAEHGGIYADMDTLFVSPLPDSFFKESFVMGLETADWSSAAKAAGGSLCNAWMMGEPGAPFVREWLSRTYESFDGSWSAHSTLLPFRLSQEHPEWIHIEPSRSFFHFDYYPAGLRGIFRRRVHDLEGIYSIHLWSHCWWDARTRNTARFHGQRLTPAYVRHADTTYAAISRPFLPLDLGRQDGATWKRERLHAAVENGAWLALGFKRKLAKTAIRLRDQIVHRVVRSDLVRRAYRACLAMPAVGRGLQWLAHIAMPAGARLWSRIPRGLGTGLWMYADLRIELGYANGDHEPWMQDLLKSQLGPGDCYYDLGAHSGFFSLIAARRVGPSGAVLAIEADPENASIVEVNVARNKLAQVAVLQAAVWSSTGQVSFESAQASTQGRVTGCAGSAANRVPAVCLDDLVFCQGHRAPDLIKMDVEGAEWEALQGARRLLTELKPKLLCEVHDPAQIDQIRGLLANHGYQTEEWRPVDPHYPDYKQLYVWAVRR